MFIFIHERVHFLSNAFAFSANLCLFVDSSVHVIGEQYMHLEEADMLFVGRRTYQ